MVWTETSYIAEKDCVVATLAVVCYYKARTSLATTIMNSTGLLTCTNYAFPPNSLHYCGPEKQSQIVAYQQEQVADEGLSQILREFQTLYPYLTLIAHENNIRDPFDPRVVEAYWIGNDLLKNVSTKHFYRHFVEALNLKKKIKHKDFELLVGKFDQGALPHHTFHVLNVFIRTDHHSIEHTIETMDACRIGWGKVVNSEQSIANSNKLTITTKPLVLKGGKLTLEKPVKKQINFDNSQFLNLKSALPNASQGGSEIENRYVTFHWNSFCDTVTDNQVRQLEHYTNLAINLANNTI